MVMKSGVDQDALVTMFAQAGARQGETLRKAVADATLRALQGRELTLDGVRKVVKSVTAAASLGAARNAASPVDLEAMLGKALQGIDSALLQAVEANRAALERFVGQGVAMTEKPMKDALAGIEKMEDVFFSAVTKATQAAGPLQRPWEQALQAMKMKGSDTGSHAGAAVESLMAQARDTMRQSRATGMRAAEEMLASYATLVSGVLIGMSEGMRAGGVAARAGGSAAAAPAAAAPAAAAPAAKAAKAARSARRGRRR